MRGGAQEVSIPPVIRGDRVLTPWSQAVRRCLQQLRDRKIVHKRRGAEPHFPVRWRIVPQGDDTVKVLDNGYRYRVGEDPVLSSFVSVADSGALTVTGPQSVWAYWTITDELIQQSAGPTAVNVNTNRKTPAGTAPTFTVSGTVVPGTSNNIQGSTVHYIELGAVDLDGSGNAYVVAQYEREYFHFPQDNWCYTS